MLNRLMLAAIAAGAIASIVSPARSTAQGIQLQLGGGASIPVGRFDSTYTSGPAGLIALTDGGAESPLGVRLDYSYNGFHGKTVDGKRYRDSHMNVVTGDLVFSLHTGPYAGQRKKPFSEARIGVPSHG